ncbi:MAG: hypothetical protein M3P04_14130 [Actinomycetota bacterium]|nr:hypothetical protein [Actinomycetota bacterium]
MRRLKHSIPLVLSAVIITACGSTVQTQGQVGSRTAGTSGLAASSAQQPQDDAGLAGIGSDATTTPAGTSGTAGVPTTSGRSVAPQQPGAVQERTTAQGGSIAKNGPVQIGFVTTSVGNAEAFGINPGTTYTDKAMYEAIVGDYNAHGGLAGHRILPVYGETDTASNNWGSDFQAVCAKFTEDNHVKAVIGYIFVFLPSFEGCLAKAGVPHLYGGYQPGDVVDQGQYRTMVSSAHPPVDGFDLTALEGAERTGLLTKSTKLGLLIDTCADGDRAYRRSVEPWLKARAINYRTFIGDCARGGTDASSAASAISSAQLQFASSGVNLVFGNAVELLLFMNNAQTQGYTPEYLTATGGGALHATGAAPSSQMKHLHGFGWTPTVDVDLQHQPATTAAQKACTDRLVKHGLQPKAYNDFMAAYATCDGLELYTQALAVGANTPQAVVNAVATAEPRLVGALTYGGRLRESPNQRGGAAVYREYGWSNSCSCLTYRGALYPLPTAH